MFEVPSIPHLLMVLVIVMLLFGANRIPEIAGSMGKGIKEFKKGVRDDLDDDETRLQRADQSFLVSTNIRKRAEEQTPQEPKRLLR